MDSSGRTEHIQAQILIARKRIDRNFEILLEPERAGIDHVMAEAQITRWDQQIQVWEKQIERLNFGEWPL